MLESINAKREEIGNVCRRHHVNRLDVFGSAARAVDFEPGRSDADFLVDFDGGYGFDRIFDLADDLEAVLSLSVDLMTRKALETSGNRRIHERIMADRQLVYEK